MQKEELKQPDNITRIEDILRIAPNSSSKWTSEITRLVIKSPDLSCLSGPKAFECIKRIEYLLNRDHYYSKDFLGRHKVTKEECLHAMDMLFTHWKGIMIFSSL